MSGAFMLKHNALSDTKASLFFANGKIAFKQRNSLRRAVFLYYQEISIQKGLKMRKDYNRGDYFKPVKNFTKLYKV